MCLPLLNPVEARQGRDGDKDDNSLLAVADLDLFKTNNQHASSRTKPWTASRPVPHKSIILWPGAASSPSSNFSQGISSLVQEYHISSNREFSDFSFRRLIFVVGKLEVKGGGASSPPIVHVFTWEQDLEDRKGGLEVFLRGKAQDGFFLIIPHGRRRTAEGAGRP